MALPYMPTLTPLAPPQCRHIWQSHGVSGYIYIYMWLFTLLRSLSCASTLCHPVSFFPLTVVSVRVPWLASCI